MQNVVRAASLQKTSSALTDSIFAQNLLCRLAARTTRYDVPAGVDSLLPIRDVAVLVNRNDEESGAYRIYRHAHGLATTIRLFLVRRASAKDTQTAFHSSEPTRYRAVFFLAQTTNRKTA